MRTTTTVVIPIRSRIRQTDSEMTTGMPIGMPVVPRAHRMPFLMHSLAMTEGKAYVDPRRSQST